MATVMTCYNVNEVLMYVCVGVHNDHEDSREDLATIISNVTFLCTCTMNLN